MGNFLGKVINGYRIEGLVGEGGMGSVFVGLHEATRRKVAIKVLYNISFQSNPDRAKRFKLEASILAKLEHPNIVKVIDFVEDENGRYLIMEFVEGKQVEEILRYKAPEEKIKNINHIFLQLLDGVGYAHQQNVIHRDLKPSNILTNKNLDVKLLDFGVAKLKEEDELHLTRTGASVGTTYYMSPEQVKGQKVEQASDIYSLGILLYEFLAGENPYTDGALSNYEISQKIVKEPLPKLTLQDRSLSDRINKIIAKATEKNPAKRFKNCHEFKIEFKKAMELGISAEELKQMPSSKSGKPIRRRTIMIAAGIIMVVAFLVIQSKKEAFDAAQTALLFKKSEKLIPRFLEVKRKLDSIKLLVNKQHIDSINDVNRHKDSSLTNKKLVLASSKITITAELRNKTTPENMLVYCQLTNNSPDEIPEFYIRLEYYDQFGFLSSDLMKESIKPYESKTIERKKNVNPTALSVISKIVDKKQANSPYHP